MVQVKEFLAVVSFLSRPKPVFLCSVTKRKRLLRRLSRLLNSKKDLNTRLPRTNPVSGQGGTWTRVFQITSPVLGSNRSATLPSLCQAEQVLIFQGSFSQFRLIRFLIGSCCRSVIIGRNIVLLWFMENIFLVKIQTNVNQRKHNFLSEISHN